jgi:AcrR family transcriptional regulator
MSSPRRDELVEAAYEHVLTTGLSGASLRPVAEAIGSSTGVLRFLFGSKDGLVTALLGRARQDELALLAAVEPGASLAEVGAQTWRWLSDPGHRRLLTLWTECYASSLVDPDGPWSGFARDTVRDWLDVLAAAQPAERRRTREGRSERTAVLAVLRGAMLDLLATGDAARTTRAVTAYLAAI